MSSAASSGHNRVGPYRLLQLLGEGGMGRVYSAEHLVTGQLVALKTANRLSDSRMSALRTEIAGLGAVSHPGIVEILDQGVEAGVPWYAMALLHGRTLRECQAQLFEPTAATNATPVTWTRSLATQSCGGTGSDAPTRQGHALAPTTLHRLLRLYRRICDPLAHLHGRGMVHRDLKPANVFICDDGQVVLMDFGLLSYATGAVGREVLDAGDRALGTIRYLAPEQIQGKQTDARADLYALGCMLYEVLTGQAPFRGAPHEVLSQHLSAPPEPLSKLNGAVQPALESLVMALLAKAPAQRLGRVTEVAAALDSYLGIEGSSIPAVTRSLHRPQLSGRDEVLNELQARAEFARNGSPAVVVLTGDSGIGKTFIASEFAARAARVGFRVITGECTITATRSGDQAIGAEPLRPLDRLIKSLADYCRARSVASGVATAYAWAAPIIPFEPSLSDFTDETVLHTPLPGAAGRERIIAALIDGLKACHQERPLLLIVDDLQWTDELTLAFLERLTQGNLRGTSLLAICTLRSDHGLESLRTLLEANSTAVLSIGQLDASSVQRMVGDMLGESRPSDAIVDFVVSRARGNPFLVAESLRFLVDGGYLSYDQNRTWRLSQTALEPLATSPQETRVEALVGHRLAALDDETQRVLGTAAALGRRFELPVLELVLGGPATKSLSIAEKYSMVERLADTRYGFVHDKLHASAYASVPKDALSGLHGRVAVALAAVIAHNDHPSLDHAEIARHFELAGDLVNAIDYYERAGDEAVAKASPLRSAVAFRAALQLAHLTQSVSTLRRARWQRELGTALYESGDFAGGSEHLYAALALLKRPAPRSNSRLAASLTRALLTQVKHLAGLRMQKNTGVSVGASSQLLLEAARTFDRLQQGYYYRGEGLPMLHACVSTLNLAEAAGPSAVLVVAYANASAVAGILPASWLVDIYKRRATNVMRSVCDPLAQSYHHMLSGVYLTGIGEWASALAALDSGLDAARRLRYARRAREIIGATGILHYLKGDHERAKELADDLLSIAVREDPQNHVWALLSRTQAQLAQGQPTGSTFADLKAAETLMTSLGKVELAWYRALNALAHDRLGDHEQADALSRDALLSLRELPPVTHYTIDAAAICAELRVRLALKAGSLTKRQHRQLARLALRVLSGYARVFPVARPRHELVRGFLAAGTHQKLAHKRFRASHSWATKLGMPFDATRAQQALSTVPFGN